MPNFRSTVHVVEFTLRSASTFVTGRVADTQKDSPLIPRLYQLRCSCPRAGCRTFNSRKENPARDTCRLALNLRGRDRQEPHTHSVQINDLIALFPTCGTMEFRVTQLVSPISVRFRLLPAGVFAVSSPMGCDAPSARRDLGTRACLASFALRSSAVASAG